MASTNYARDYDGQIVGEENVGDVPTYKLELKAKTPDATYDRIRYWVSKATKLAVKAEFLTVQGAPFKIAQFEYGNTISTPEGPVAFIRTMRIVDASFAENVTVLTYVNPRPETHPVAMFNINNVVR